jgi:hypothetical protein
MSCDNNHINTSTDCSYKIFSTLDKGFRSFKIKNQPDITFEYPGCYKFYYPGTPSNKNAMRFDFIKDIDNYLTNSAIEVSVKQLESTNTVLIVSKTIDIFLEDTKNDRSYDNFSIIERKSILVNEMQRENVTVLVHEKATKEYPEMDVTIKQVVFEQKGYIWIFLLNCNSKDFSLNMPYFDHLLDTFKIVENPPVIV